jgi:hypothetical protein
VGASTCVICSVVVSILAMGLQHTGSVSNRVGRACVRNGFMYLTSKSAHIRASHALSFSLFPPPFSRDSSAISYKQRGSCLQNNLPYHIVSMINHSEVFYNNAPTISYLKHGQNFVVVSNKYSMFQNEYICTWEWLRYRAMGKWLIAVWFI